MIVNGYEVTDGVLDLRNSGLKIIESKAFWACRAIREVLMPEGVMHVGDWAFAKCANLEKVTFAGVHRHGIFGRDVFKGCDKLRCISFCDQDDVTALFLALCANRLGFDRLIQSDDVGQKSWYEKWDICLTTRLKSDDAEAKMSAALCGEEDISYDGIGSVDGEMPGEGADYVSKEAYNRCALCYIRLSNERFLSKDTRELAEKYILDNRFGEASSDSFYSIFEECGSDLSYLRIYLDIVKPDRTTLFDMIDALGPSEVLARSFLINESNTGGDTLDDMML